MSSSPPPLCGTTKGILILILICLFWSIVSQRIPVCQPAGMGWGGSTEENINKVNGHFDMRLKQIFKLSLRRFYKELLFLLNVCNLWSIWFLHITCMSTFLTSNMHSVIKRSKLKPFSHSLSRTSSTCGVDAELDSGWSEIWILKSEKKRDLWRIAAISPFTSTATSFCKLHKTKHWPNLSNNWICFFEIRKYDTYIII